jgi:hypothetical protein
MSANEVHFTVLPITKSRLAHRKDKFGIYRSLSDQYYAAPAKQGQGVATLQMKIPGLWSRREFKAESESEGILGGVGVGRNFSRSRSE